MQYVDFQNQGTSKHSQFLMLRWNCECWCSYVRYADMGSLVVNYCCKDFFTKWNRLVVCITCDILFEKEVNKVYLSQQGQFYTLIHIFCNDDGFFSYFWMSFSLLSILQGVWLCKSSNSSKKIVQLQFFSGNHHGWDSI